MKQISNESEALARSGQWCVISTENLCLFLRRHFEGTPLVASWNVSCFLRLMQEPLWTINTENTYRWSLGSRVSLRSFVSRFTLYNISQRQTNCVQLSKVNKWCHYWFFSHYNGYHSTEKNREAILANWYHCPRVIVVVATPYCTTTQFLFYFNVDMISTVLGPMISLKMVAILMAIWDFTENSDLYK